ncbi:16S rRNA (uracil(1498)-N(3))-methyltransferase [Gilvimarinus algae]|uniref:Ribosomal RNA small subunit methyltransferase E n=1 Tax=Gilvimarinus algae TaxID=3058037 RepID=A0ABT8TEW5_9GAMM|nr:16S rRNA (uracil(1498)-N(3))-methyltransferase [Gilvimarinus sp. SDUM040014]MDO3382624.1 16S rRNA (uracil(1498)-N(3))-methyltransferase [Gilvimarinus sp. SDUM040014]
MNLILLFPDDFTHGDTVCLRDRRRVEHILRIQKAQSGDRLRVGLVNGLMGEALVTETSADSIHLSVHLQYRPPPASPISMILALPRPPMLKRCLQTISALGIKELILLQSARVEKSYWQSPQLREEKIREELVLGLEQSCDTRLPNVRFAKRFRPFIEDELTEHVATRQALIAHPYASKPCPHGQTAPCVLAIGPEGGFLDQEIEAFSERGFTGVTLGERILRVETAVPYLLGRLSDLLPDC